MNDKRNDDLRSAGEKVRRSVSVVIPAYNEQAGVGDVVAHVSSVLTEADVLFEVIVVDDGSTDDTADAAVQVGAEVIRHQANRGYGASLKTGILAARYETICITDADGTYPIERIPDLLAEFETTDMVVGSRTGKSVAIPLVRRPAKWLLNRLANYITGQRIPDLNSGMRVFDREHAIQYFNILSDQFSFTTTITMATLCDKYAVKYIPIDYAARKGRSKIVPWDAANFMVLILRAAMLFRPLRVFFPCASLCFIYAVTKGAWDIVITGDRNISTTAAVAMISALQLGLIGMLGDAIATHLRRMSGTAKYSLSQRIGHRTSAKMSRSDPGIDPGVDPGEHDSGVEQEARLYS